MSGAGAVSGAGRGGRPRAGSVRLGGSVGTGAMRSGGAGWRLALALLVLPAGLGKPTARQERARAGVAQHEDRPGFQYDHEAFLGKEEARSFDQLSPEESRERLG